VYAVTEAQYRHVMKGDPTYLVNPTGDDRPVTMITYNDIRGENNPGTAPSAGFLWALSNKVDSLGGVALAFDLPTEAQWEVACRAGTIGTFNFTDDAMNPLTDTTWTPAINEVAWWAGNRMAGDAAYGNNVGRPVGLKRANRVGLYDMHGNVWEWCRDGWAAGTYPAVGGGNQPVLGSATTRSIRGGMWSDTASFVRSVYRVNNGPTSRNTSIGFRICARGPEVPAP